MEAKHPLTINQVKLTFMQWNYQTRLIQIIQIFHIHQSHGYNLFLQRTVLADNKMALTASCLGGKYMQMNVPVFILCDLTHSHITGLCTKLLSYKRTVPLLLVINEIACTSKMFQSHHKCQKFSMPTVYFNSVTIYPTT